MYMLCSIADHCLMFILLLLHHRGIEATAATFCLFEVSQMCCMDNLVDPPRWRNLKFKKISSLYLFAALNKKGLWHVERKFSLCDFNAAQSCSLVLSPCTLQKKGHRECLIDLVKQRGKRTGKMWHIFIKWSGRAPLEHFTASAGLLSWALYITRLSMLMMTK